MNNKRNDLTVVRFLEKKIEAALDDGKDIGDIVAKLELDYRPDLVEAARDIVFFK